MAKVPFCIRMHTECHHKDRSKKYGCEKEDINCALLNSASEEAQKIARNLVLHDDYFTLLKPWELATLYGVSEDEVVPSTAWCARHQASLILDDREITRLCQESLKGEL